MSEHTNDHHLFRQLNSHSSVIFGKSGLLACSLFQVNLSCSSVVCSIHCIACVSTCVQFTEKRAVSRFRHRYTGSDDSLEKVFMRSSKFVANGGPSSNNMMMIKLRKNGCAACIGYMKNTCKVLVWVT